MKVLIVEEALKTLHGHWFQYISDIVNGGRAAGHEIEVAVHKDACREILSALPCRPILSRSVFDNNGGSGGSLGGLRRIWAHNRSLYRDLLQFLDRTDPYDLIVATTPRLDHLLAHELLHWRYRRVKQRRVLIFVESVGEYSADYSRLQFSKKSIPLKLAFQFSRLLPNQKQFILATESEGLARQFEEFCGLPFALVPHVTHLPVLDAYRTNRKPPKEKELILGTYGFMRYDKGGDILHAAIKLLSNSNCQKSVRFAIQWTGDYRLPDGSWVRKEAVLEQSGVVQYIPPFVTSVEYFEHLAGTDIMVLPYRKNFYYDKLSRVAIDASLAGMPLIYPQGTWLAWFAENHAAGVAFEPDNPVSLAKAVEEAVARFPELKRQAEARKQSTTEAFSARRFFELIAALPGK
jgi:glycosyltransferase involved in cell wall biosynthesis